MQQNDKKKTWRSPAGEISEITFFLECDEPIRKLRGLRYITVNLGQVDFHYSRKRILHRHASLTSVEMQLPEDGFLRIKLNTIISMDSVRNCKRRGKTVTLELTGNKRLTMVNQDVISRFFELIVKYPKIKGDRK
jgi:DNA-binding LytR/AlgR family response regulator